MATIFVDESGHTGSNLLDPAQPVFTLSTHDIDESEAREIRAEYFGFSKANSLKFTQLARRPRGQDAILRFLEGMMHSHQGHFGTHVIHKPFAMVCKLVDHLVETSMHAQGYDLNERGANLGLSNAIYLVTHSLAGEDYLSRLLNAGQRLFTGESLVGATFLSEILEEKTGLQSGQDTDGPLAGFLSPLHLALHDVGPYFLAHLDKDDLLISFTSALVTMGYWSDRHGSNLHVIHDESSVMLQQFEDWVKVTNSSVPETVVGMDRRVMRYPIGVKSTRFEPDEKWAGLQLADVVAGAFFKVGPHIAKLSKNKPTEFDTRLIEIMDRWPLIDNIWPAPNFTPEELGTEGPKYRDPIEFHMNLLRDNDAQA